MRTATRHANPRVTLTRADPEALTGGRRTGSLDLSKDQAAWIYKKPKDNKWATEPTGLNIKDLCKRQSAI